MHRSKCRRKTGRLLIRLEIRLGSRESTAILVMQGDIRKQRGGGISGSGVASYTCSPSRLGRSTEGVSRVFCPSRLLPHLAVSSNVAVGGRLRCGWLAVI